MATRKASVPWKDWGLGGEKIAAKLKGARSRDRSVDTPQFTALRNHVKDSRGRLEDLKAVSQQALETYRSEQNIGWAKLIFEFGIKQRGRLGSVLQLLGNVQQKIDLERAKAQASAQEEFGRAVCRILDDDFKATREKKLELFKARADLEESVQKVQHYRRKMKDGKQNQESKLEQSMKELLRARDTFTKLNVEVTRGLVELEVNTSMNLVKATAAYMSAEAVALEKGLQDLEAVADPLHRLVTELHPDSATDLLTPPQHATEAPLPELQDILFSVSNLEPRHDGKGRLQEAYVVSLNEGSTIASHAGTIKALANLRAQKPVPGVVSGEEMDVRGKDGVVFGRALEDIPCRAPMNENIISIPDDMAQPPWVVEELCRILGERGKHVEGLFRVSGSQKRTEILKEQIEDGKLHSLDSAQPHDLAALLKMFLRELPEPLVPFGLYFEFVETSIRLQSMPLRDHVPKIEEFLRKLPQRHMVTLERLVALLDIIVSNPETRMDSSSISICLAHGISRPPSGSDESVDVLVSHAGTTAYFLRCLIDTYHTRPKTYLSPASSLISSQPDTSATHSRQPSMTEINYDLLTGQLPNHRAQHSGQATVPEQEEPTGRTSVDRCSNHSHSQFGERSSVHSQRGNLESANDDTSSQASFGGSVGNMEEIQTISRTSSKRSGAAPSRERPSMDTESARPSEERQSADSTSESDAWAMSQQATMPVPSHSAGLNGSSSRPPSISELQPRSFSNSRGSLNNQEGATTFGEGQWQEFPASPSQIEESGIHRSASSPSRQQCGPGTPKYTGMSQATMDISPPGVKQMADESPSAFQNARSLHLNTQLLPGSRAGSATPPPASHARQSSLTSTTTNPFDSLSMSPRSGFGHGEAHTPSGPANVLMGHGSGTGSTEHSIANLTIEAGPADEADAELGTIPDGLSPKLGAMAPGASADGSPRAAGKDLSSEWEHFDARPADFEGKPTKVIESNSASKNSASDQSM